jgi:hypothetical protein
MTRIELGSGLALAALSTLFLLPGAAATAGEGMWMPEQLPRIERDLRDTGLRLRAEALSDLTGFPMGAVISLGGCTASFVSAEGLVVTNHHCARGSVQFNSSEENNYLADGFIAATKGDELRAAPGTRVYVTTEVTNVTEQVTGNLAAGLAPRDRYQAIEDRSKALVAGCEARGGVRCRVASYYGGAQYRLIERLEIRDVRLVYAPADSIGKYGGDVDNWMWPRHTGDFAFYRAYVAPDGSPADYADENVPYRPRHFLKVSRSGLSEGDYVMAAGYPGTTNRYALLSEVEETFGWFYPTFETLLAGWIAVIEGAAPAGSDARIKYEARLAGLNNTMKNFGGQIEGARRVGLARRRAEREAALAEWIAGKPSRADYARALADIQAVVGETNAARRENFWYNNATRPQLLSAAQQLYRLAVEREKPDAEREPGYQDRDLNFIRQRMEIIDRRYDAVVDRAEWLFFLERYMDRPVQQRVAVLDDALGLGRSFDAESAGRLIDRYYADTELDDVETRLAWMDRSRAEFESSEDPFMQLAVSLYPHEMAIEEDDKTRAGRMQQLRPLYMDAIIAWSEDQGRAVYPDANSSLRVTYGTVRGGSPRDGLVYEPFTRLAGILEKDTGEAPFDSPKRQLEAIAAGDFGRYALDDIGSVPVNFLSDLDSTGGNSGSPTMDARGNLVGLLFDGTIESVNSDWDFDPRTTRTIHVDTRYMLWVMEFVDDAKHLIDEMELTRTD